MIRMMPKISVNPLAMKNNTAACESAPRHCARIKPRKVMVGLSWPVLSWPLTRDAYEKGLPTARQAARSRRSYILALVAGAAAIRRGRLARVDLDDLADRLR